LPEEKTRFSKADVKDYEHNLGELASFYAKIGEAAEVETIQKLFNSVPSQGRNIFKCIRADGQLAGLMRAWTDESRGIVYDIAVAAKYRRQHVGQALRDYICEQKGTTADSRPQTILWQGYPYRISAYLDRDLSIIRILYAISFVLGFQKLGEAAYLLLFQGNPTVDLSGKMKVLLVLLFLSLTFLGFRFFWAIGNIRRFVLRRISELRPPRRQHVVALHMAILFCYPALFFFLCRLLQDFCQNLALLPFARQFITVYSILLLANAVWLLILTYGSAHKDQEWLWLINNAAVGVTAVLWLYFGLCQGISPLIITYGATLLLLANNLVDLLFTSKAYIMGDAQTGG
jgi:hypothetical protein